MKRLRWRINQSMVPVTQLLAIRLIIVVLGSCLVVHIIRRPLYWHSKTEASCPPCLCACSSESPLALLSACASADTSTKEETVKSVTTLLAEELNLREVVAEDVNKQKESSILDAKKMASHFQKEAEKCNGGVEACEKARERVEAALRAELKLSALWEKRARGRGWTDNRC